MGGLGTDFRDGNADGSRVSDAPVINNWPARSDQGACTGIVTQVVTPSVDEPDGLDKLW